MIDKNKFIDLLRKFENEDDDDDGDEIMLSIPTIEKILVLQKFISYKEGRELGFSETINYLLGEFMDKEILKINS